LKKPDPSRSSIMLSLFMGLACTTGQAQLDNEFYARADVSTNLINMNSLFPQQQEWQSNSNASRVGFRGSYQISESLELIYQLELEVNFDDDDSISARGKDLFENRNSYLGIRGNFGQIIAGKNDTPIKTMGREVDRFNDQVLGDIKSYMEGEDRVGDLVMYTTPNWQGFSVTAGIVTEENQKVIDGHGGFAEATVMSFNYSNDFVTAAIGINDNIDKQNLTRVMTNFYIGATEVGFMWQRAERVDNDADEKSWLLSAEHRINEDWRIKGQFGLTDYSVHSNQDEQFILGLDRILNSSIFLFINYVEVERDKAVASFTDSSLAIGIRINL